MIEYIKNKIVGFVNSESSEEDFEDVAQDFQVKSHRKVKISSVGLSAKAKKSLKVKMIKLINKQE